jgi:hypothetical protein
MCTILLPNKAKVSYIKMVLRCISVNMDIKVLQANLHKVYRNPDIGDYAVYIYNLLVLEQMR